MVSQIKAHEMRTKTKEELEKQLEELKQELVELRVAKVTGGAPAKLSQIKVVRKAIARCNTIIHQKEKAEVLASYEGKKYLPKKLRPKLTKRVRQRLKTNEKYKLCSSGNPNEKVKAYRLRVSHKKMVKEMNFPMRIFAVKA
eukprot:maker-scaffold_25-snap-gene-3.67-mRNA-1 protein AED:0.01 eAED:0.01 QI:137/1/1/1/1/1/2/303/141